MLKGAGVTKMVGFRACQGNPKGEHGEYTHSLRKKYTINSVPAEKVHIHGSEIVLDEYNVIRSRHPIFKNFMDLALKALINIGIGVGTTLVPGTCLSQKSITSAPPFYNEEHVDRGDSFGLILWYQLGEGTIAGGEFVLPELGLEIELGHGSILLFDTSTLIHHTKPITTASIGTRRLGTSLFTKKSTITVGLGIYNKGKKRPKHGFTVSFNAGKINLHF